MPTNVVIRPTAGPAGASQYAITDATGDGVTDDTAKILHAVDALDAKGGGLLFFEGHRTYRFSDMVLPPSVGFRSTGRGATQLLYTGTSTAMKFTRGLANCPILDIKIKALKPAAEVAIEIEGVYNPCIERISIDGLAVEGNIGSFQHAAILIHGAAVTGNNSAVTNISKNSINNCAGDGIRIEPFQMANINIAGNLLQGNGGWGVNAHIDASQSWASCNIENNDIEGCLQGGITGTLVRTRIAGNHFETAYYQIYPTIMVRQFPDPTIISGAPPIEVTHAAYGLTIENNFISNQGSIDPVPSSPTYGHLRPNTLGGVWLVYLSPIVGAKAVVSRNNWMLTNADASGGYFLNSVSGAEIGPDLWAPGSSNQEYCHLNTNGNRSIQLAGGVNQSGNLVLPTQFPHAKKAITLSNGANHDVVTEMYSYIVATGPTAPCSISGFNDGLNPQDGWERVVYFPVNQDLTLTNNAGSAAGRRVRTLTGADIVLAARADGHLVHFRYDQTSGYWLVMHTN